MITSELLHPASIVVVGASNNVHKPGGAILKNLISGGYTGELRAVNPKEQEVQGIRAYADVKDIPDTDLAILAICAPSSSSPPASARRRTRGRCSRTVSWRPSTATVPRSSAPTASAT